MQPHLGIQAQSSVHIVRASERANQGSQGSDVRDHSRLQLCLFRLPLLPVTACLPRAVTVAASMHVCAVAAACILLLHFPGLLRRLCFV